MSNILSKIKKLFEEQEVEAYKRYDDLHPLDIFLGIDDMGRKSLVVTLQSETEKVISSKIISVEFFRRKDGRTSLRFSLEDDNFKDIFYKFCEDVIESTQSSEPKSEFSPIIRRWNTWIDVFAKTALPLSESEIIGLIGELYFLKNFMFEKYGINKSIDAFIGVDKEHKDFEIDNTWFEVKTIHNGIRSVRISSIEQLDSERDGNLVVIVLDRGTLNTTGSITLNSMVKEVRSLLDSSQVDEFDEKIRKTNYVYDERYDEFAYLFIKETFYKVSDDFPRVKGGSLPPGITRASYEIDISALERFTI